MLEKDAIYDPIYMNSKNTNQSKGTESRSLVFWGQELGGGRGRDYKGAQGNFWS